MNAAAVVFSQSGYAFTNGQLTFVGPLPAITNNASTLIESTIAGSNGLTFYGTGTLELDGTNDYTGTSLINSGTRRLERAADELFWAIEALSSLKNGKYTFGDDQGHPTGPTTAASLSRNAPSI